MVFEKTELDSVMDSIRKERISQRQIPIQINKTLIDLKSKEPDSINPFFRLAIIGYEFGKVFASLEHAIVYTERFKKGNYQEDKEYKSYLKSAQLELGDCFTQLQLLAQTYGFDLDETRLLGAQHLAERHEDFKIKGWVDIK